MGDFEILDLIDANKWNEYIQLLPKNQQDVYYTPGYYNLFEDLGDGKATCFVYKEGQNLALYPFLINSVNDLGYELGRKYYDIQGAYGYNGLIASSIEKDFILNYFKAFHAYCKEQEIIAEFTRFHPLLMNEQVFKENLEIIFNRKTVFLELTSGYQNILKHSYNKQVGKKCRKASTEGLSYLIADKEKDYDDFYELYIETMKNLNANSYYYFSPEMFKNIRVYLHDHHSLILAKLDDKIVGGFILIYDGIYAHNFLSAGLFKYRSLNVNDFMQDVAIQIAIKKNCTYLHFGGGNSSDENDSLYSFKCKFSNMKSKFYIGKKIHNVNVYKDVVNQWSVKYPEKDELYKNMLLKYRN